MTAESEAKGQQVAAHVRKTVEYLRDGKVTRAEATSVKTAAERAISDLDLSRSVGH
jgi:hypothetical protein